MACCENHDIKGHNEDLPVIEDEFRGALIDCFLDQSVEKQKGSLSYPFIYTQRNQSAD
ncbi:protein of unknown function [Pseudomonas marincola]|uniref:Uncharacterized protein n=1 Tax=Pseudomonas marincola TaxID=437900 RepID=A0A8S2BGK3_9PSED|nr:protein of unknown function [Pseudomonas marincola]